MTLEELFTGAKRKLGLSTQSTYPYFLHQEMAVEIVVEWGKRDGDIISFGR